MSPREKDIKGGCRRIFRTRLQQVGSLPEAQWLPDREIPAEPAFMADQSLNLNKLSDD